MQKPYEINKPQETQMTINHETLTLDQLENMSDEDFAKLDPSQLPDLDHSQTGEQHQEPEQVQEVVEPEVTPTVEQEVPTPENDVDVPSLETPNGEASAAEAHRAGEFQGEGTETKTEVTTEKPTEEVAPEKAFFEKVTAKFNASGKEFQVNDPNDVISLMQKGIDYNHKMAAMKPSMKMVKALQQAGIESVDDLGFLIDLKNKNPEAIAKLVQESGIDTYDLNEEKAATYVPSVPEVSDAQINFELAAKSLESNPHFGRVVQELGSFDDVTKQEVFNKPQLLNVLTEHVGLGYYDQIVSRLQQEQAVGRLNGVPFLQAYDMVGNMLFGQPQQQQVVQQPVVTPAQTATPVPVPVATKPNTVNNTARQAAAGTPGTASQSQKMALTPEQLWNLSDEEFAKIDPKFL